MTTWVLIAVWIGIYALLMATAAALIAHFIVKGRTSDDTD
jgi:hypothetical protein